MTMVCGLLLRPSSNKLRPNLSGYSYITVWRFTPTSVGTTVSPLALKPIPIRFTPTSVGTTSWLLPSLLHQCGSPPLAWGQPTVRPYVSFWRPVHPHQRGDKAAAVLNALRHQRFGTSRIIISIILNQVLNALRHQRFGTIGF